MVMWVTGDREYLVDGWLWARVWFWNKGEKKRKISDIHWSHISSTANENGW